jgi:pimeloyl-ACP methyl ester carboxylesterase
MATSIDNPFAVARNRSEKAGEVLADALINKAQGERPVSLIGYSLGSRVIYSCLRSLADRRAFGLIENVVLIGSPVPSTSENWRVMRSVVSGKMYNVYSNNDYILAFLYRATSIQLGVAGLQAIADVEGVSNLDLSKEVSGHLRYPDLIGKILKRAGFEGIAVEDTDIEGDVGEIQLVDVETEGMKVDADAVHLKSQVDVLRVVGGEPVVRPAAVTAESAPPPRTSRTEIPDFTRGMSDLTSPHSQTHCDDSDSDSGGIQMIDNDSDEDYDGELQELSHEPIPDDDLSPSSPDLRDSGKVPLAVEQKTLGSFPRGPNPSASSSGGRLKASDLGLY